MSAFDEFLGNITGKPRETGALDPQYGVPYEMADAARNNVWGSMGGYLLAAAQRQTPEQRNAYFAQAMQAPSALPQEMYKIAQTRLLGIKAQQEQGDQRRLAAFAAGVSGQTPSMQGQTENGGETEGKADLLNMLLPEQRAAVNNHLQLSGDAKGARDLALQYISANGKGRSETELASTRKRQEIAELYGVSLQVADDIMNNRMQVSNNPATGQREIVNPRTGEVKPIVAPSQKTPPPSFVPANAPDAPTAPAPLPVSTPAPNSVSATPPQGALLPSQTPSSPQSYGKGELAGSGGFSGILHRTTNALGGIVGATPSQSQDKAVALDLFKKQINNQLNDLYAPEEGKSTNESRKQAAALHIPTDIAADSARTLQATKATMNGIAAREAELRANLQNEAKPEAKNKIREKIAYLQRVKNDVLTLQQQVTPVFQSKIPVSGLQKIK